MPFLNSTQLEAETFLQGIEVHTEIASTNDRALSLADAPLRTPYLILAELQTQGRGRGKNRWWAGAGALTFSLVLGKEDVNLPAERWPRVSLSTGLSVCELVADFLPDHPVALKWPNDVLLGGKKVCGILLEVLPQPHRLILGIGFNLNNSLQSAPEEIRERGTSLTDLTGQRHDPTEFLVSFFQYLERNLRELQFAPEQAARNWSKWCYLRGRMVEVQTGQETIAGYCLGIGPTGTLQLQTPLGVREVLSGVVTRIGSMS